VRFLGTVSWGLAGTDYSEGTRQRAFSSSCMWSGGRTSRVVIRGRRLLELLQLDLVAM